MGYKRFSGLLLLRLGLIMLTLVMITVLIFQPGYHATMLLLFGLLMAFVFEMLRFINKTNAELVRFLAVLRHGELTRQFDFTGHGSGFEELGVSLTAILLRFQQERESKEQSLRYLKALIDQVPVPLVSLHADQRVSLCNQSARRLFANQPLQRIEDLHPSNSELADLIHLLKPGEKQLASFDNDGISHQLALSATQIVMDDKCEKLISLQDIRSELDLAQLQAWQDLVRVLTHEIMNSITPVASLADTASDLVGDVIEQNTFSAQTTEQLSDVQDAVTRLSKRSNSLMNFVSGYRRLTRLPAPTMAQVDMRLVFDNTISLVTQTWQQLGISLEVEMAFEPLLVSIDACMIEQILINLLQNAEQAVQNRRDPKVNLKAFLNKNGRPVIQVIDNGPGIEASIIDKVFVPFFTTKREGSGVGLALTRQVMIAHGGNVKVDKGESGGARFTLTF